MASDGIPPAVKQLLSRYIRSVEQLEVLLLVRSQPARSWTAADVYEVIRSSTSSIAARLRDFTTAGFLAETPGPTPSFRYAPKSTDLSAAVEETARFYETRRVRVIEAIFAPDVDPVQSFADAFKLRKD